MPATTTALRLGISKNWPFHAYFLSFKSSEVNYVPNIIESLIRKKFYRQRFWNLNILYSHSVISLRGRVLIVYCYLHDEVIGRELGEVILRRQLVVTPGCALFYEKLLLKKTKRLFLFNLQIKHLIRDLMHANLAKFIVFKIFFLTTIKHYNVETYGNYIKRRLEQKYSLFRVIKPLLRAISLLPMVRGVKFKCVGRFNKIQRVKTHYFQYGRIAFNSFTTVVDHKIVEPILKYSICSIKIWINYSSKGWIPYKTLPALQCFYKFRKVKGYLQKFFYKYKKLIFMKPHWTYKLLVRSTNVKEKWVYFYEKRKYKFIYMSIYKFFCQMWSLKNIYTNRFILKKLIKIQKYYKCNFVLTRKKKCVNFDVIYLSKLKSQHFCWFLYTYLKV
jgi:hypothetical protein